MTTLEGLVRASTKNRERLRNVLANGADIGDIHVGIEPVMQWQATAILLCQALTACAARLPDGDPARVEAEKLLDAGTFADRLEEYEKCEI